MFGTRKSKLRKAIEHGIAEGNLSDKLHKLGDVTLKTVDDADAVCWGLRQLGNQESEEFVELTQALAYLCQSVNEEEPGVIAHMHEQALPELFRLYDQVPKTGDFETVDLRLFLLKMFALHNTEEGTDRVIEAARAKFNPEGYMWSVVLANYGREHDYRKKLFDALSNPLPPGFIAVSLLDAATAAAIEGGEFSHPFDSAEGVEKLRGWLRDPNPEHFSYAHSATASLPFISEPACSELLQLAMDHPDSGVSVEAAWAAGKLGQERGITQLARFAKDIKTSRTACAYLEELGREDAIPDTSQDADFQAKAEMVNWLTHPNEFGEPPDEIEQVDSRELFWPPTNDRRYVWLFKYRYAANDRREKEDTGLGMVGGSSTFALFGETTADLDPMDAYALHCCWELEHTNDERAPKERSIAAGRKLLAQNNSF